MELKFKNRHNADTTDLFIERVRSYMLSTTASDAGQAQTFCLPGVGLLKWKGFVSLPSSDNNPSSPTLAAGVNEFLDAVKAVSAS